MPRTFLTIVNHIVRNILGVLCIAFGILGGFIPILQGWLFILIGISLLKFPGKDKLIARIKKMRYVAPLARKYDRWKVELHRRRAAARASRKLHGRVQKAINDARK